MPFFVPFCATTKTQQASFGVEQWSGFEITIRKSKRKRAKDSPKKRVDGSIDRLSDSFIHSRVPNQEDADPERFTPSPNGIARTPLEGSELLPHTTRMVSRREHLSHASIDGVDSHLSTDNCPGESGSFRPAQTPHDRYVT